MLDAVFGNYTDLNKSKFKQIVTKSSNLESSLNITTSKKKIRVNIDGQSVVMTEEEYVFLNETNKLRERLRNGASINDIMPRALAICREATNRKLGMRPYDVQVEAAAAMQNNNIVEMKTGEGKSLVQILSAYLNALDATKSLNKDEWESVHVLTSNDYLASRDEQTNRSVFNLLGLSCACAQSNDVAKSATKEERKRFKQEKRNAYKCDIVYSTAKTVAFDYLSDNTAMKEENKYIIRPLHRAIIDEADNILFDQATTPLILSRNEVDNENIEPHEELYTTSALYKWATEFINSPMWGRKDGLPCSIFSQFEKEKYTDFIGSALFLDKKEIVLSSVVEEQIRKSAESEKYKFPTLTDMDINLIELLRLNAVEKCLLAKYSFKKGEQYIVEDNKIILLSNGRKMPKSKYRDGMQEAIEYKEEYELNKKSKGREHIKMTQGMYEVAKCTYPDFLSIYKDGICGMTGTSDVEEFRDIYGLNTYKVDSRVPSVRIDEEDELYSTKDAKYEVIIKDVLSCQSTGQPVLIGTLSIQESDEICKRLEEYGIRFQRLDAISAKDMKNEAAIVSTAGLFGSVTVATNMAGRGTDIKLGPGVKEVGGLYVIGTSKNKNSRIDNQLRGRAGRQGDPGRCKYFSSLDDELVQTRNNSNKFIFFKKKYKNIKEKLNNKKLIKLVSLCQKVEESIAKLSRKSNENRELISFTPYKKIVYEQRAKVLKSSGDDYLKYLDQIVDSYTKKVFAQKSDYEYISQKFQGIVDIEKDAYQKVLAKSGKDINVVFSAAIKRRIHSSLVTSDAKKNFCEKNKIKTLKCIDDNWVSYIYSLEEYNKGSYLLQYGANYSKDTYKMDTHMMYDNMIENMQNEIIAYAVNSKLEYGKYKVAISENNMGAIL